ncbi:hypothetical protein AB0B07_33230 [Streptomyces sioyaensis]|uniref:hypothetical protein n=1 Tax=Streptomyces sioyaensis TaxID=67364 RepID=UPI0033FA56C8
MSDSIDQHLADSATRTETDDVLDRLTVDNDRMLTALDEVIDVEAGLQQILDRAKEA